MLREVSEVFYPKLYNVVEKLEIVYKRKIAPAEKYFLFNDFHLSPLSDSSFIANPMMILIGQYSTGKTTIVQYLLGKDYPGMRIGPEPTTDSFVVMMHGPKDAVIPGNVMVSDASKPYHHLSKFGNIFLNRFQGSVMDSEILQKVTIVDTPGILYEDQELLERGYDFTSVLLWFAEIADRILLTFDVNKLEITKEFQKIIRALRPYDEKVRVLFNKADVLDPHQMMRAYGALMWSLGKAFHCPEAKRVYIGSFWDRPYQFDENRELFDAEAKDLTKDLVGLPKTALLMKLNNVAKRARMLKVHAYLIIELRSRMPTLLGRDRKKRDLIDHLDEIYKTLETKLRLTPADFPQLYYMRRKLKKADFCKFPPMNSAMIQAVDEVLTKDLTNIMLSYRQTISDLASTERYETSRSSIVNTSNETLDDDDYNE